MAYGLQVFNASGKKTVSMDGNNIRLHQLIYYTPNIPTDLTSINKQYISVPGIFENGNWYVGGVQQGCTARIIPNYIELNISPYTYSGMHSVILFKR